MVRYTLGSLALGLMTLALSMAPTSVGYSEELKVGDPAPNFELVGSDGETHKLADYKGKQAVVIAWYPRAFTGGCTAECKSFAAEGEKIRKFNVAYFTASTDDAEKNKKFAESVEADYPILSDPNGVAAGAFGIYNPTRKAALRKTFYIGKDGKLLHIDEKVNTKSHGADVAAKLEELGVERN